MTVNLTWGTTIKSSTSSACNFESRGCEWLSWNEREPNKGTSIIKVFNSKDKTCRSWIEGGRDLESD